MSQENTNPAADADATDAGAASAESKSTPAASTLPPDSVEAKMMEYLEGWQRERAEFTNYKRRAEKDRMEAHTRGGIDMVVKLLPIIDDFQRAMANVPAEWDGTPWLNGITLLLSKFEKLLAEARVEKMDPVGQLFDPNLHEAIGVDEPTDEIGSGHVTATLQPGYLSGERVLRHALVRVAR